MEIRCIVVDDAHRRKGIGKSLLRALLVEANPKSALCTVTFAFDTADEYPQHLFYRNMGFKQVSEDDRYFLYYPLKEGFVYRGELKGYIPQEEDKGKALIGIDPSCPWAIYFTEKIEQMIKEIIPDICIKRINILRILMKSRKEGFACLCDKHEAHKSVIS